MEMLQLKIFENMKNLVISFIVTMELTYVRDIMIYINITNFVLIS